MAPLVFIFYRPSFTKNLSGSTRTNSGQVFAE